MLAPKVKPAAGATSKAAITRTALNASPVVVGSLKNQAAGANKLKRCASAAGAPSAPSAGLKSTSRSSLLSDTTLSVCSLASSQATSSACGSKAAPAPAAPIKKSSSSLSGAVGLSARQRASSSSAASTNGSTTALSFSGIKRPPTASAPTSRKPSSLSAGASSSSSSAAAAAAAAAAATTTTRAKPGANLSAATAALSRRVPTLAVSLRDKDQQIKLLIRERDERKFQAELMGRQAEEWRQKYEASELERSHMTSEADDEVVELRRLAQELEDENKTLAQRLAASEQAASEHQFKLVELQCERDELAKELEFKEEQLQELESERSQVAGGQKSAPEIVTERAMSRAKYEREIEELKEKITCRDEQMIQLRSSLEMRKNEVTNLQQHAADLERKLRIESERSERHLKRIDEVNLELKAAEAKLTTKGEENEMQEKQIRQLRHELRQAQEKLEQMSLARKRDVDILHGKLAAARRGSTTPSGANSPQPAAAAAAAFKTPTPQDEIVRLQMEIRDLKDQLIDREAELDCNRRDLEVMRRKMETRTLEVDCNNQELARRCQDLLEQNRQSEDTIKQLLRSTTEHSASLMRATDELKEANAKCAKLREQIGQLEARLEQQLKLADELTRDNESLREQSCERAEQVALLRHQIDSLNGQIGELCAQLDHQTSSLHKDRETLADQLSEHEIQAAQLRHDLAGARQDLRTQKLQQQEITSERDRLRADLELRDNCIRSRNEVLETMRHELEHCQRSLAEHKTKLESLRASSERQLELSRRELADQIGQLQRDLQLKVEENAALASQCAELRARLDQLAAARELEVDEKFDEMRRKHSEEIDQLHVRLQTLEEELEEARTSTLKRSDGQAASKANKSAHSGSQEASEGQQFELEAKCSQLDDASKQTYESEIEFLNSVVVDMQRKCDSYRSQLAHFERRHFAQQLDELLEPPVSQQKQPQQQQQQKPTSRASTLKRADKEATLTRQRVVRIQDPLDELLLEASAAPPRPPTRHISGRPYCDICQVYDTHHTIYCPKVGEKLAARNGPAEAADHDACNTSKNNLSNLNNNNNNNNNNGLHPNGYSQQAVDDMFREYVEALEGPGSRQVSYAPFTSLRRPTKQQQQQHSERFGTRLHCENCDLFGHSAQSCSMIKIG